MNREKTCIWSNVGVLRKAFLVGLVFVLLVMCRTSLAAEYYLVRDGEPKARILLPRVFGKATVRAANELSDYIEKMTGARIPVDYDRSSEGRYGIPYEVRIVLLPKIDPATEISADGMVKKGTSVSAPSRNSCKFSATYAPRHNETSTS